MRTAPDAGIDGTTVSPGLAPVAWAPVLLIAGLVAVAHALVATRYGWHRDEFYYVATGQRLAWGYVDQPPFVPFLARVASWASAGLWPLRALVIGFQAATIVGGALLAREMGGRRRAQALAAGCLAGCPILVGASLFLGTTPTDQFFWALVLWCVVRALRTGTTRWWVGAGIVSGVGLENKHTVVLLLVGILVGLAWRRRDVLRVPGPWVAAVIALALWAPNLWWETRHHWESLDMARALAADQGGTTGAIGQLPLLLLVFPGPLILFVAVRGIRYAAGDGDGNQFSWLLPGSLVVVVAVILAGGKPYYAAPLVVPFFALGSVATERGAFGQRRLAQSAVVPLVAASMLLSALGGLPYLPPSVASALPSADLMETFGWPDFARQVASATASDPAAVAVYASNYGEAGALRTFGHSAGLSLPVVIGQNAYRDWGPPPGTPTDVIAVGEFGRGFLLESWSDVQPIAVITLPDGLQNEETQNDATIYRCRGPRGTWSELWPKLSYLS